MQRKVQADEAQKQRQDKRDKLESNFSSSYAKRLKADKDTGKDRRVLTSTPSVFRQIYVLSLKDYVLVRHNNTTVEREVLND